MFEFTTRPPEARAAECWYPSASAFARRNEQAAQGGQSVRHNTRAGLSHCHARELEVMDLAPSTRKDAYFKPSFFPAARSSIDSRIRFSRVSGRLAV